MRLHFLALSVILAVAYVAPHSAEADQGQQAAQRTRVKRLKPSADTDVVLNEALLATDGAGRTRLLLGTELSGDEKFRAVTIVDRAAGTLALVTLSGDHRRDAIRVRQAYKRRGVDVEEQQLFESLRTQKDFVDQQESELRRRAGRPPTNAARTIEKSGNPVAALGRFFRDTFLSVGKKGEMPARATLLPRPAAPAPGAPGRSPLRVNAESAETCDATPLLENESAQWVDLCNGYAYSLVETWEPAAFVLPVEILNRSSFSGSVSVPSCESKIPYLYKCGGTGITEACLVSAPRSVV